MIHDELIVGRESEVKESRKKKTYSIPNAHACLWMSAVLVAVDVFSLLLAMVISSQLRMLNIRVLTSDEYVSFFIMLSLFMVLSFYRSELYPALGMNFVEESRRVVTNASFAFLIIITFTFWLKTSSIYSRIVLGLTWLLCPVFILVLRQLVRRLLIRLGLWGEPVVIIGDLEKTLPLEKYFRRNPRFSIRPVAILRDEHCASCGMHNYHALTADDIKGLVQRHAIQTGIIVPNDYNQIDDWIDRYRYIFRNLILVRYQRGNYGLNTLVPLDFADVLGLQVRHNLVSFWPQLFKRAFDVMGSFFGMLFLLPFLSLLALLIRLDSPGEIFYRQERLGKGGKNFRLLKFRTMYRDAERLLQEHLAQHPELKKEWAQYQKLRNDPRITRVGHFLRKWSLDELPQLWNVLRGEMSLVGPRPITLDQQELYGKNLKDYIQVTPGITGLWQISGRNYTTFARRAELDYEYIQRWSFWLDLHILFETVNVVLGRRGAY